MGDRNVEKVRFMREHRMVDLAQLLGFEGGDARDAAMYLGRKLGCGIYYSTLFSYWYFFTNDFDKDPKKLTFILLKYGSYLV